MVFPKKARFPIWRLKCIGVKTMIQRVDIYSLGIVLYRLRNHNRLPFIDLEKQLITYRDKENALTRRMSGEELPAPAEAADGLAKVILKACAYRRENRYQTPEEFQGGVGSSQISGTKNASKAYGRT